MRPFPWRIARIDGILVGQVSFELGVSGWKDWHEEDSSGICWSGICEDYLGNGYGKDGLCNFLNRARVDGGCLSSLIGRYAFIGWDKQTKYAMLCAGSYEAPTLWMTNGPQGWAAGSRTSVLQSLSGTPREINEEAAAEYAALGYLVGDHAFRKNFERLPLRTRIVVQDGVPPFIDQYAKLQGTITPVKSTGITPAIVATAAEAICNRVAIQLKYSTSPQALLSGGKDSRCVVAAMVHNGYRGTAWTSGPRSSDDVIFARRACQILGLDWEKVQEGEGGGSPMKPLLQFPDRLLDWARLSDGMVSVENAIHLHGIFNRKAPFPERKRQLFHGQNPIEPWMPHGPHMDLPTKNDRVRSFFDALVSNHLPLRHDRAKTIERVVSYCEPRYDEVTTDFSQWLQIFYWQNRTAHMFADILSSEDSWYWRWTPLVHPTFIQSGLYALPFERVSKQLTIRIAEHIFPPLTGSSMTARAERIRGSARLLQQTKRILLGRHPRLPYRGRLAVYPIPPDRYLHRFWNEVLFKGVNHVWPNFLDREIVRSLAHRSPLSSALWKAATIELAARAIYEVDSEQYL